MRDESVPVSFPLPGAALATIEAIGVPEAFKPGCRSAFEVPAGSLNETLRDVERARPTRRALLGAGSEGLTPQRLWPVLGEPLGAWKRCFRASEGELSRGKPPVEGKGPCGALCGFREPRGRPPLGRGRAAGLLGRHGLRAERNTRPS